MAFDPTKIGSQFRYNDASVALNAGATPNVVPPNPYRVALFMSTSTASVFIRPNLPATALLGQIVPNGQAALQIKIQDSGPLCQQQWNAFCAGGGMMYFFEVLWVPPGV